MTDVVSAMGYKAKEGKSKRTEPVIKMLSRCAVYIAYMQYTLTTEWPSQVIDRNLQGSDFD